MFTPHRRILLYLFATLILTLPFFHYHPRLSPPPRPRIAVCIAGHLRTFRNHTIHQFLHSNLLSPLRTTHHVDLIFHLGLSDIPRANTLINPSLTSFQLHKLLTPFHPILISTFHNDLTPCPIACTIRCAHSLVRMNECINLIQSIEREDKIYYQWIYYTRPDIVLASKITSPTYLRNDTVYTDSHNPGTAVHSHRVIGKLFPRSVRIMRAGLGDHIVVAHRNIARVVFRAVESMKECMVLKALRKVGTVNSEVLLTYWLAKYNVRVETRDWFWMLVREGKGPECERVRWISNNSTRVREMIHVCQRFKAKLGVNV